MTDIEQLTKLRQRMLANGYTPLPNFDKRCFLQGWPSVEVTDAVIEAWGTRKSPVRRHMGIGIRIENGLIVIDIDVNHDQETADAIAAALDTVVPGLSQSALVRWGKGFKEAWFLRCDETFGRLHSRGWVAPGSSEDAGVHRIEIFGGASSRQFGAWGPHTQRDDGTVEVVYEWDGPSPVDTPLAALPCVSKDDLFRIIDAVEAVLAARGWTPVLRSAKGENVEERIYALTDAMRFDVIDGRGLSLSELRAAAESEDGLRCSASWLEGPSAVNRTRCLVSIARNGGVAIWESASGVTYLEADRAPANPLKRQADFDRLAEKLAELDAKRRSKITSDDDAMLAAAKLLETWAFCPNLRNGIVPIWADDLDAGISMQAFRTMMMPNISEETGPRGGRVVINPVDLWAANAKRQTVQGLRMRPDMPRPLYKDDKGLWINVYSPPTLSTEGGDAEPFFDFLRRLIPDRRELTYFVQWLAYKFRYPYIPGPAIVMMAREFGTGRGTLAAILAVLLGRQYVRNLPFHIVAGKSYQSQYNDWGATALLVVVNESSESEGSVFKAKQNAYEQLKELVEPRPIERFFVRKGERSFSALSFTSYIIATNHYDALSIPATDRRFAVITNGRPQPVSYYEQLNEWMLDPANIGAVARALVQVDLTGYSPFQAPPMFEGKATMVDAAQSDLEKAADLALANLTSDCFVLDQVLKLMRQGAEVYGFDFPDRWQPIAKRIVTGRAWRVGEPDGINWHPAINGKRFAVYARTAEAAARWKRSDRLREEVLKNGDPAGNVIAGLFKRTEK